MPRNSGRRRPGRGTMAGMIYDANQSLNWIVNDPNITEAFRNSSIVHNNIMGSSLSMGTKNYSKEFTSDAKEDGDSKDGSGNGNDNGNTLGRALNSSGSLANLFSDDEERDLLGIGFFTIWEAGLFFSGYFGSGVVMSRNIMNGEWSSPVAVGLSGVGAGLLIGASVRSIVYLIYDYFTLKSIIGTDGGIIFGLGAGATIGTWTKETGKQSAYITSPKMLRTAGIGTNVALCRGLAGFHGGVNIEAGICKTRDKINSRFYGKEKTTGSDILLSGEPIEIPNSSRGDGHLGTSNYQAKRLMEMVHSKLKKLCLREDPEPYNNSSSNFESARASLEELYADESYDFGDDYDIQIKGDDSDNKSEEKDVDLVKGDESHSSSKSPSLTKEESASTSISKDSDEDEAEEEEATPNSDISK